MLLIAGVILLIYVLLTLVALVIDGGALLVSALAYVVGAVSNSSRPPARSRPACPLRDWSSAAAPAALGLVDRAGGAASSMPLPGRWQAALPPA